MLRELTVEKFRALDQFALAKLGRVNLLVGTNNCGKTTILEAIQILEARGEPRSLWSALFRRGERTWDEVDRPVARAPEAEVDVCHLFHGHAIAPGTFFAIQGRNDAASGSERVGAMIVESVVGGADGPSGAELRQEALAFDDEAPFPGRVALSLKWSGPTEALEQLLPLTRRGGLRASALERARSVEDGKPIRFITTASLDREDIVALFEAIVLTPEEAVLIEALNTIDPTIERIAPLGGRRRSYLGDRGGIVVKCAGANQRIPIGSMGDGIWRMLGIALCLVRTPNGILLVDEIDTGLHYSVMANMWRLVLRTAQRLNVQVFATTHSRDCYESLAAISRTDVSGGNEVSIQRIERGRKEATAFTEPEIVVAATRGIEVR